MLSSGFSQNGAKLKPLISLRIGRTYPGSPPEVEGLYKTKIDMAEIGDVERMLKALIKFLEKEHLDPGILEPLNPFSQLIGRRTKKG